LSSGDSLVERFDYQGATLVAEVAGVPSSEHIVFLHGWGGSRESLRGIAVLFQHTSQVHLIDLPGFGEAPIPPATWGTVEYTALVERYLLDRIKPPRGDTPDILDILIVGHSFGSRLAIRLAAKGLPGVRGAVLLAAPGLPANGISKRRLRRWGVRGLRRMLVGIRPIVGSKPLDWHSRQFGSTDYLAAGDLRPILIRTVNEDLTESARAVRCPVLLVYGSDDEETPPWLGARYRELMNGRATLEILRHKDHHELYTGTGAHLSAFKIREWLSSGRVSQLGRVGQAGRPGPFGPGEQTNG
jgi:pimeloyl-ACP methyl ester carboxylesterase